VSRQRTILTGEIERETPTALFEALHREFRFDVDACARPENAKVAKWFGLQRDGTFVDGLEAPWSRPGRARTTVWCNPPYAHGSLALWLRKAWLETESGVTTVFLLPVDTSTVWFHSFVRDAEVRFLRGRLRFGGTKGPAPFASMIVIIRPREEGVVTCRL